MPGGDYLLALKYWHEITSASYFPYELVIDITHLGNWYWAFYESIEIGSAEEKYELKLGGLDLAGTAGGDLNDSNNVKFSAFDQDNDSHVDLNCAQHFNRPFWVRNCGYVGPLGDYFHTGSTTFVYWDSITGDANPLS